MHGVLNNERKMFNDDEMMVHYGTQEKVDKFVK